jgi:DNA repair ATPase RecN
MNKNIKPIVEKYIGSIDEKMKLAKKKDAINKIEKTIDSITNEKHINSVIKMIENFSEQPGRFKKRFNTYSELLDKLNFKVQKLYHEGKIKYGTLEMMEKKLKKVAGKV